MFLFFHSFKKTAIAFSSYGIVGDGNGIQTNDRRWSILILILICSHTIYGCTTRTINQLTERMLKWYAYWKITDEMCGCYRCNQIIFLFSHCECVQCIKLWFCGFCTNENIYLSFFSYDCRGIPLRPMMTNSIFSYFILMLAFDNKK